MGHVKLYDLVIKGEITPKEAVTIIKNKETNYERQIKNIRNA